MARIIFPSETGESDMKQADVTSQVNSERTSFTLPENYQAGSLRVYYNGLRQVEGETFDEHNSTTFVTNFTPQTGDYLTCDYIPQ